MEIGINVANITKPPTKRLHDQVKQNVQYVLDQTNRKHDSEIYLYDTRKVSSFRIKTLLRPTAGSDSFRKLSYERRRCFAVCYHAHLAFFVELYNLYPLAVVRTKLVSWNSRTDFLTADLERIAWNDYYGEPYLLQCTCSRERANKAHAAFVAAYEKWRSSPI